MAVHNGLDPAVWGAWAYVAVVEDGSADRELARRAHRLFVAVLEGAELTPELTALLHDDTALADLRRLVAGAQQR